ncbi:MAG: hypothetical protein Q9181_003743 [Wetmoreana brouardii]
MRNILSFYLFAIAFMVCLGSSMPVDRVKSLRARNKLTVCDNSMTTLAGSIFKPDPQMNITLSALNILRGGRFHHRGLATGDPVIVWCLKNSSTYVSINTSTEIAPSPGFNITETLRYGIKDVEARITQVGNAVVWGGQWGLAFSETNSISVKDTGDPDSKNKFKHLTWPILRDGLKALSDFITLMNLAHNARGLQFGINSAFFGQVGMGYIG